MPWRNLAKWWIHCVSRLVRAGVVNGFHSTTCSRLTYGHGLDSLGPEKPAAVKVVHHCFGWPSGHHYSCGCTSRLDSCCWPLFFFRLTWNALQEASGITIKKMLVRCSRNGHQSDDPAAPSLAFYLPLTTNNANLIGHPLRRASHKSHSSSFTIEII